MRAMVFSHGASGMRLERNNPKPFIMSSRCPDIELVRYWFPKPTEFLIGIGIGFNLTDAEPSACAKHRQTGVQHSLRIQQKKPAIVAGFFI